MPPPPRVATGVPPRPATSPSDPTPPPVVPADAARDLAFFRLLPPFYARQPGAHSRQRQVELWRDMLVSIAMLAAQGLQQGTVGASRPTSPQPDSTGGSAKTDHVAEPEEEHDDPLLARSNLAFIVPPHSLVYASAALGRRMPEADVHELMADLLDADAEEVDDPLDAGSAMVVGGAGDASLRHGILRHDRGLLVMAFSLPSFLDRIQRLSDAEAATHDVSGVTGSVHTLPDLMEALPDTVAMPSSGPSSSSRVEYSLGTLTRLPDVQHAVAELQRDCRATVREVLSAVAEDDACCRRLHATPMRVKASGLLRGLKIARKG